MTVKAFLTDQQQIIRMLVTALFVFGLAITSYYLFAFRVDKFGMYYKDADQLGLSIGVAIVALGWFIRNWKKIV